MTRYISKWQSGGLPPYSCTSAKVGLVTSASMPNPCARPRTNAVFPMPIPPKERQHSHRAALLQKLCLRLLFPVRCWCEWYAWSYPSFLIVAIKRHKSLSNSCKLCLKLSYHKCKAFKYKKWRCRLAAGGVSRRQTFSMLQTLFEAIIPHSGGKGKPGVSHYFLF